MQRACKCDRGALLFPVLTPLSKLPNAWSMLDLSFFLFVEEQLEVLVACRKTVLGLKNSCCLACLTSAPMFRHIFVCFDDAPTFIANHWRNFLFDALVPTYGPLAIKIQNDLRELWNQRLTNPPCVSYATIDIYIYILAISYTTQASDKCHPNNWVLVPNVQVNSPLCKATKDLRFKNQNDSAKHSSKCKIGMEHDGAWSFFETQLLFTNESETDTVQLKLKGVRF